MEIINKLLRIIFETSDAVNETDNHERQLTCIQMKFHLCQDLAKACKISIQDLLKHASHKVYGMILQLMLLSPDVIKIISSYITLKFFKEEILHKGWYYLLVNDLLTREILEQNVLSLTEDGSEDGDRLFTLKDL